jgi:hypothetical protein
MKMSISAPPITPQAQVSYCPRCRHAVRFNQARSDGAWVCQKCLRYRVATLQDERRATRELAHA